jgi:hypothetical protein
MPTNEFKKLRLFIGNEHKFFSQLQRYQNLMDELIIAPWISLEVYEMLIQSLEDLVSFQAQFVAHLKSEKKIELMHVEFVNCWFYLLSTLPLAIETAERYRRHQLMERALRPFTEFQPPWANLISVLDCPRQHFSKYIKKLAALLEECPSVSGFIAELMELDSKVAQAQELIRHKSVTKQLLSKISRLDVTLTYHICLESTSTVSVK